MRTLLALTALAALTAAAPPIAIRNAAPLSPADIAAIEAIEAKLLASLMSKGAQATLLEIKGNGLPSDILNDAKTVDSRCGSIVEAERANRRTVGSKYVRDEIVLTYTNCLIRWEVTLAKEQGRWDYRLLYFSTPDRGW